MHTPRGRVKDCNTAIHASVGQGKGNNSVVHTPQGESNTITQLHAIRDGELKTTTQVCTLRGGDLKTMTQLCAPKGGGGLKNTTELTHHDLSDECDVTLMTVLDLSNCVCCRDGFKLSGRASRRRVFK